MNLAELPQKGKDLLARVPKDVFVVLILILSSSASFGLGILAGKGSGDSQGFSLSESPMVSINDPVGTTSTSYLAGGQVIASKNGSKYFLPWCSGALAIPDANKIWFTTREEAEAKGYTPASTCKGL